MLVKSWSVCLLVLGCGLTAIQAEVAADEGLASTRPEMKKRIEALKERTSRLPLPPPTEQELASGRSLVNNGRLRSIYLPTSWQPFLVPGWEKGERRRC